MNRLKELRQEKKLSQKEIALELQVPPRTYQRWENGESQIKPDKAQALADYFGVSVGYLLGYSDNPRRYDDEIVAEKDDGELFIYSADRNLDKMATEEFLEYLWFLRDHSFYLSNNEIISSYKNLQKNSLNHGQSGFEFLKRFFKSPYDLINEAENSEEYSYIFGEEYARPPLLDEIKCYIDDETASGSKAKHLLDVLKKEYGERNYLD
ncbi:helix-turn-helix domain-containing protein [Streptococcus suis]